MNRKFDLVFAALFVLLFIGWLASDMPAHLGLIDPSTGWYAREIDPIFRDPPSWLSTSGWFGFAFGPLYAGAAYGFIRRSSWLPYVVLPLAGMVVAMTGLYLIEDVTGDVRPLNWTAFDLLNAPYIVVPVLAALWLFAREGVGHRVKRGASPIRATRQPIPTGFRAGEDLAPVEHAPLPVHSEWQCTTIYFVNITCLAAAGRRCSGILIADGRSTRNHDVRTLDNVSASG